MELQNKAVVITGAKGGLGTFVTNAFLQAGARVIGVSRSIIDADFVNDRFSAIAAEISSLESAAKVIAAAVERAGRVDALVHLMGAFTGGQSIAETDDAAFDRMFELNLRSAFHMMRAALPVMRTQGAGRVLLIGSKAAVEPSPMAGVYAASKAALVSLAQTAARENADCGITVNIVLPGTMDTPANRAAMPAVDPNTWVQPASVAGLLLHLASDAAAQVSGAVIPVCGREA